MEQMPYYIPPEDGWKKHFEGLIPILILVLIAIVLVGKTTNYFCSVPGLNYVFCGKGQTNVGLLGDFSATANTEIKASVFKSVLDAEGGKYNIYSRPIVIQALEYPQQNLLKQFDVVVVAGVQNLTYAAREALGNYIANGGKVILIGDAGVRDPKDPLIKGWSAAAFGDYAPVRLAISGPVTGNNFPRVNITEPQLNYFIETNPIIKDYADAYLLNFTEITASESCHQIDSIDVAPKDGNAEMIATLTSGDGSNFVPAIVERKTGLGSGDVLYFDYDPGCTRSAVIATLKYLAGR
jgi:hypothetical protein